LKADKSVVAWGSDAYGQCDVPPPKEGFVAVAGGVEHSVYLIDDGRIVASGGNDFGQCNVPSGYDVFVAVSAGGFHNLALKADGSVVAWGFDGDGQCDVPSPNEGFVAVAAGGLHSVGLKSDGSVVAWGWNGQGQCNVPLPNEGFVAIAAGDFYSVALKQPTRATSEPRTDSTLPRTTDNLIVLVFDRSVALPAGPALSVVPMAGGPDVGGSFSYSLATTIVPNDTLEAREGGTVLADQTWYRITPVAGLDVAAFTLEVCTLPADADGSGEVTTADYSVIKAHLGERGDSRYDLNGSGRVTTADYSVVKAHLGERAPDKP
jgi:hypothetical protein